MQEVGRMVLNKNCDNFFTESEQLAFCPGLIIPGIQLSDLFFILVCICLHNCLSVSLPLCVLASRPPCSSGGSPGSFCLSACLSICPSVSVSVSVPLCFCLCVSMFVSVLVSTPVSHVCMYVIELPRCPFLETHEGPSEAGGVLFVFSSYSDDKLLQTRIFSYSDTQRHRLGANYLQLPVNAPRCLYRENHNEGASNFAHKSGHVNYNPSSHDPVKMAAPTPMPSSVVCGERLKKIIEKVTAATPF